MATNPLYLNTPPSTQKEHNVKLTVVKGDSSSKNESLAELMNQICAMIQLLHLVEGELALNQTKMAGLNNVAAQLNVDAVTAEGKQAVDTAQQAIQAQEPSWLKTALMAVFSVVMIALAFVTFGATAAILALVIVLITTVPLPFLGGKTLVGFISSKIAEAIGKDRGWSPAEIQAWTGYINLIFAVVLLFASAGLSFAGASVEIANAAVMVGEDVAEEAIEMADIAAASASSIAEDSAPVIEETASAASQSSKAMNVAKFSAVNAFTSQVTNSNCISDIMMGTLMSVNPNASAKEKEAIAIIAAILSILVAVCGAFAGGKIAMSNAGEDLAEGGSLISKITSKLGTSAKSLIAAAETGNGAIQGGVNIYQGSVEIEIGQLNAAVTRLLGGMKASEEISAQIKQSMNQINTLLKDYTSEYSALERSMKSIGLYDRAEVNAMLQANQQA